MMRFLLGTLMVFLLTIILTDKVSAIRINELEANPEGEDPGFEWIELYSEENINLEGYFLDHEGTGAPINLTSRFSGFFVINLEKRWLRNNNETVYLKLNNDIIQTVGPFSDNKVNKTYSFCDGEWKFISSSKNAANSCTIQTPTNTNNNQNVEEEEIVEIEEDTENENTEITNNSFVAQSAQLVETKNSKISLIKEDKNYEVTRTYKTRVGVIYFFIGFCVLITILIALRKL